ncbi:MAG: hypothetical protein ACFFD8_07265 [Candidatus Thorarchaeota archaeon]
MQISPDAQLLGLLFDAIMMIFLFLIASLFLMKLVDIISQRIGTFIRYLAFPGIVLHEVCHDFFCRITGIPIHEHRIFVGNKNGVSGGVVVDARQFRSFTSGLLVGFAPLLILALALYLLLTFWPIVPMHTGLKYYFAFCFFIGLSPSKADVSLVVSVARERPRQTLFELSLLGLPMLAGIIYLALCFHDFFSFSIWFFSGVLLGGGVIAFLLWHTIKPSRNS